MADRGKAHDVDEKVGRTIVARFGSRAEARDAIAQLHKAHYSHTWLGSTSLAQTDRGGDAVTVETGGFFSGTQSLVEALVSRGVLGSAARSLESQIEPGDAVLTVDPKDKDPRDAIGILQDHDGEVAGSPTSLDPATRTLRRTANDAGDVSDVEWEEMVFERR